MIITTTPTIEGRPIKEYKGIVTGETIIGANFIKDFLAGIRDFIGGRSAAYEKVLREGKETCRTGWFYAHGHLFWYCRSNIRDGCHKS